MVRPLEAISVRQSALQFHFNSWPNRCPVGNYVFFLWESAKCVSYGLFKDVPQRTLSEEWNRLPLGGYPAFPIHFSCCVVGPCWARTWLRGDNPKWVWGDI